MSLSLMKRGRTYYAEGRCNGERVHQSLKTKDLTVAKALLRDLELRLLSGGRLVSKPWKDFAAEFKAWISTQVRTGHDSTLDRYEFVVDRFSRFLEAKTVLEVQHVDAAVLAAYGLDRQADIHPVTKRAATQNTIRSDFRILHRVFAYAVQCKYLASNPVVWQRPLKTNREKRPFTAGQLGAMLEDKQVSQRPMMRAIVLMFTHTGLRISDVCGLKREAVDLRAERIVTKTQKRQKVVTLAIHPELRGALELYYQCRTDAQQASPFVFSKADGAQLDRRGLTSTFTRIFARAGIEGGHVHRFRHTFAVRLLTDGASLYDTAKMLGIDMATCEQYYSPYCKELQDRGAKLVRALPAIGDTGRDKVVTLLVGGTKKW